MPLYERKKPKVDPVRLIQITVAAKRVKEIQVMLDRANAKYDRAFETLNKAEQHEWAKRNGTFRDKRQDNNFKKGDTVDV